MTRSIPSIAYTALQQRKAFARDFLWIVARDRNTGAPVTDGYWSDVGTFECEVIDPDTGGPVLRSHVGAAMLIKISDIPLSSRISIQTITIRLAQCAARVNQLVRQYDCKQAIVQVHRGLFDPQTHNLLCPAFPRFDGFINGAPIKTPKDGEEGDVTLSAVSHSQEVTRSNPDTRSDASQRGRSATDNFFEGADTAAERQAYWGRASGNVAVSNGSKAGLLQ